MEQKLFIGTKSEKGKGLFAVLYIKSNGEVQLQINFTEKQTYFDLKDTILTKYYVSPHTLNVWIYKAKYGSIYSEIKRLESHGFELNDLENNDDFLKLIAKII